MLTLTQFESLLGSYGADLARWPQEHRAAAQALLADSSPAQSLHAEACRIDEVLSAASARADRQLWPADQAPGAALERLRAGVARRIATPAPAKMPTLPERLAALIQAGGARSLLALSTAGCVAIIAGLLIGAWLAAPAAGGDDSLLTALQPMPLHL
jgi:hypothetical protein